MSETAFLLVAQSWPLSNQMADIKNCTNFTFCFGIFIAVFDKHANIRCGIGSISRPISSRDHNAMDQAIATDRYQRYFRKLDNFFSGKQQGAVRTDQKNSSSCLRFLHGGKNFQSSYIILNIFSS